MINRILIDRRIIISIHFYCVREYLFMASTIKPGTVLKARYKIEQAIYESPFVNIYYASDTHMKGMFWAVREMKIVASDNTEKLNYIAKFKNEAAAMASFSHPLLTKTVDFFTDSGYIYIVREYASGTDLESKLAKQHSPFRENDVIMWSLQIADLFAFLISKKMPSLYFKEFNMGNIILLANNQIKLLDLGIAKIFYSDTDFEQLGQLGASEYGAPEQYGENSSFDARSLVYSLGAFMFHALSNVNPALTPHNIQSLTLLNPNISKNTQEIVRKAIDPDPKKRFASLTDFRRALASRVKGSASPSTIPKPYNPASDSSGVKNLLFLGVAALLLGIIGFMIYFFFLK